uniref:Uncharacterized protein n=1 Tax=Arundo donax TaxID=35708 RepID=A0A0A9D025_ARUDO
MSTIFHFGTLLDGLEELVP